MTLIAGLVCKDAIVFAADSEESGGIRKANVEKVAHTKIGKMDGVVEVLGGTKYCRIVVAGAGNGILADHARERILSEVKATSTLAEAKNKIFEILKYIYEINVPLHPGGDADFELLIGIRASDQDRARLYSTSGITIVERTGYFVCGSGSVVDYILDGCYYEGMATEDGISAALYMLQIAKKYVGGVGGESNITTLENFGIVKTKPFWEISEEENLASQYSWQASSLLLSCLRTEGATDADFDQKLESFVTQVRYLRARKKDSDRKLEQAIVAFRAKQSTSEKSEPKP